jgi:hypothetical protein
VRTVETGRLHRAGGLADGSLVAAQAASHDERDPGQSGNAEQEQDKPSRPDHHEETEDENGEAADGDHAAAQPRALRRRLERRAGVFRNGLFQRACVHRFPGFPASPQFANRAFTPLYRDRRRDA